MVETLVGKTRVSEAFRRLAYAEESGGILHALVEATALTDVGTALTVIIINLRLNGHPTPSEREKSTEKISNKNP